MLMTIYNAIMAFTGWMWGLPMLVVLIGGGLWITVSCDFVQVKHLGQALKHAVGNALHGDKGEGKITGYQAMTACLANTIGTGNIVGVGSAIALGGPGAVFWMWVIGFIAMALKVVICMSSASGFGKGIATEMAREGARVVICTSEAFKAELDQAVVDIEKETGNRPYAYMYDVLDNDSITAMINQVAADLGGVYGLVNHCPGPKAGTFEALTEADWADGYQKCLHSYTYAIRAALPYMKQGGGGRIVNSTTSSIKQALDNLILSNTFRMGAVGMSKTMAREFGQYNILVNTMGPGRIYTDRIKYLNTIRAEKAGITLEEYNTRDAASFPQKRYQTADEYARSVVFMCSPANSAISGQVICVDGAMTTAY